MASKYESDPGGERVILDDQALDFLECRDNYI